MSWDRYGESKKYTEAPDTNKNPKHVGESLRQLTMEDRLELRKQQRELVQKRKQQFSGGSVDLGDDDDEGSVAGDSTGGASPSGVGAARPLKAPRRSTSQDGLVVLAEDSAEQTRTNGAPVVLADEVDANSEKQPIGPAVVFAEEDSETTVVNGTSARAPATNGALVVEIGETNGRRRVAAAKASYRRPVGVVDAMNKPSAVDAEQPQVAKPNKAAAKKVEDLEAIVELDGDAPASDGATRRARRKAAAARAKAANGVEVAPLVQVLE